MRAHEGVCHVCGEGAADSIDHLVPVAWGGSDDPSNLAPAHTSCNSARGDARPPEWAYERPSMWLPGYGPRSSNARSAQRAGRPGCGTYALAVLLGLMSGGVVSSIGVPAPVTLITAFAVAAIVVMLMRRRFKASSASRPALQGAQGQAFIDARGVMVDGGRAADRAPEGDEMLTVEVAITGDNAETLFTLLRLGPGDEGFRDGLLGMEGADLSVFAMVRLTADVEASGDGDTSAAPIGCIAADVWRGYPGLVRSLEKSMVSVQVGLGVDSRSERRCWVSLRRSVAMARTDQSTHGG
jgi:hypothetical protein